MKGESLTDTIRTIEQYAGIFILFLFFPAFLFFISTRHFLTTKKEITKRRERKEEKNRKTWVLGLLLFLSVFFFPFSFFLFPFFLLFSCSLSLFNFFSDIIVLRHPGIGSAHRCAEVLSKPIINAGDGSGEHPTQALLGKEKEKKMKDKKISFELFQNDKQPNNFVSILFFLLFFFSFF